MPSVTEEIATARTTGYVTAIRLSLSLLHDPKLAREQVVVRLLDELRKLVESPVKG